MRRSHNRGASLLDHADSQFVPRPGGAEGAFASFASLSAGDGAASHGKCGVTMATGRHSKGSVPVMPPIPVPVPLPVPVPDFE
jgi:hypothetical protein